MGSPSRWGSVRNPRTSSHRTARVGTGSAAKSERFWPASHQGWLRTPDPHHPQLCTLPARSASLGPGWPWAIFRELSGSHETYSTHTAHSQAPVLLSPGTASSPLALQAPLPTSSSRLISHPPPFSSLTGEPHGGPCSPPAPWHPGTPRSRPTARGQWGVHRQEGLGSDFVRHHGLTRDRV